MATKARAFEKSVFVNCPFDKRYKHLFDAIVFTIYDCGFTPRCALEISDGGVRITKIIKIIAECKLGIHDICRTGLDVKHRLPRFNMPLELGLFLGAKHFGRTQSEKMSLILDKERYRYQIFISDLAGYDIVAHDDSASKLIQKVRDWLATHNNGNILPSGKHVEGRFHEFQVDLPKIRRALKLTGSSLIFTDLVYVIKTWNKLKAKP